MKKNESDRANKFDRESSPFSNFINFNLKCTRGMFRGSFENSLEREEEKMLYDAISISIFNMRGDIFFFRLFVCLFAVKKKVRKKYLHIELNSRDKRGKKRDYPNNSLRDLLRWKKFSNWIDRRKLIIFSFRGVATNLQLGDPVSRGLLAA